MNYMILCLCYNIRGCLAGVAGTILRIYYPFADSHLTFVKKQIQ
jgi:hypothetical protein